MKSLLRITVATAIIALASVTASALGIGEPTLHSLLGQKLDAEMEFIKPGDLAPEEMTVSIAHNDGAWSSVKATISKRSDGKIVVQLHSSEVINEPYLEFTVVIRWPQGELRREVTLLLDTPGAGSPGTR